MVLRVGSGMSMVSKVESGMSRVRLGLAGSPTRNCRLGDSPAWSVCTGRRS